MKRFIRTITGKVMLFICFIIMIGIVAGCVAGAVAAGEMGAYIGTQDEFIYKNIGKKIENDTWRYLYDTIYSEKTGIYVSPDKDTNLRYWITTLKGTVVARSERTDPTANTNEPKYYLYYAVKKETNGNETIYNYYNWTFLGREEEKNPSRYRGWEREGYTVYELCAYVDQNTEIKDIYSFILWLMAEIYALRYVVYPVGILALLLAVLSFIALMCVSARKPGTEELYPGVLNRVPLEVMLIIVGGLILFNVFILTANMYSWAILIVVGLWVYFSTVSLVLGFSMSVAARIKQKTLLKNTLVWRGIRWIGRILRTIGQWAGTIGEKMPLIWQTLLILTGIMLTELIALSIDMENYIVFWMIEKLVLTPLILAVVLNLRKLQKGGEALAAGAFGYQVDTRGIHGALKRHGENLNSIGDGMAHAVNMRLKSERMKTELITNVSHDIKTPLTSIINYADLISKEPCENQKIIEYAEVLTRQSERLKRLIEDLVEASKAATGNLKVDLSPCDAGIFIAQTAGEYEQKFKEANLELITKGPQEPVPVMADGRRMLRVFDNLMSNIHKYALSGTRVYLSLERKGDQAEIVFKNVSKQALENNAEELIERFVRGDSSRNTEGNGLGLSIAKSLTELQKGTLNLEVDGDLFKVILHFPIVKEEIMSVASEQKNEE